jgi:hypothetical protein
MYREHGYFKKKRILRNSNFFDLTPICKFNHEIDAEGNGLLILFSESCFSHG